MHRNLEKKKDPFPGNSKDKDGLRPPLLYLFEVFLKKKKTTTTTVSVIMYYSLHRLKRACANFWHDDFWDGLGGNAFIIIS